MSQVAISKIHLFLNTVASGVFLTFYLLFKGDTPSVLSDVCKEMHKLSQEVHKFGFDIVFAQLKKHLVRLAEMEVCFYCYTTLCLWLENVTGINMAGLSLYNS